MTEHEPATSRSNGPNRVSNADNAIGPANRRRLHVAIKRIAIVAVLAIVVWKLYADRDYWRTAWSERTVWPNDIERPKKASARPAAKSEFELAAAIIPIDEIRAGGPPKDGIPALTNPKLIEAGEASFLDAADRVIGVAADGHARAYPLKILNYHEIVNDRIGEVPVAVTYCPLCDSCAVFDRRSESGDREFGVSGLLYNSNVLMYDRDGQPHSLWSQILTQGVSGPSVGKSLPALPLELTTWKDWRARHPKTTVLSIETGHFRNYHRNPYGSYFDSPRLMFPVQLTSDRLPPKARVLGVWTGSAARAYPESVFDSDRQHIEDVLDGKRIVIEFNPEARCLRVADSDDNVSWLYSLWFAWYAMRSETDVFRPQVSQ